MSSANKIGSTTPISILLVEDDLLQAASLQHQLSEAGYEIVAIATEGKESIAQAKALTPDIVLMNFALSGEMDSTEASKIIQTLCDIPVLFLTSSPEGEFLQRTKIAASYAYLLKPSTDREIRMAIEIALSRHKAAQAERNSLQLIIGNWTEKPDYSELDLQTAIAIQQSLLQRAQDAELRYKTLVEHAADALFLFDLDGRFVEVNQQACVSTGYTREELLQLGISDITPGFDLALRQPVWHAFELGTRYDLTSTHRRKDGETFLVDIHLAVLQLSGRKVIMALASDITERKQLEAKLQLTQFVSDHAPYCIYWIDKHARICYANAAASNELGYPNEELLTKSVPDIDPDFPAESWASHWQDLQQKGVLVFETRHQRKDGSIIPIEVSANYLNFNGKELNIAYARNITLRKRIENEIHNMAFYDSLTGLPNRRLLKDRLNQAIAAAKRSGLHCAVLFLDLDNFKPLNDRYGHDVGDNLLINAAHRLETCVREVDTVSRFGGDEFVLVLKELAADSKASAKQAFAVAAKIRAAMEDPYILKISHAKIAENAIEHSCTSSIGIAICTSHEITADELIRQADAAMYQSKNAGCNQINFFDPITYAGCSTACS